MAATLVRIPNFLGTGVDLMPLPRTPGFRQVDWQLLTRTGANASPYTGTEQILSWPGAESWMAMVTLPPLTRADGARWSAVLMGMRGRLNAFQISDQLYALALPPDPTLNLPSFTPYAPLNQSGAEGASPVVDSTTSTTNAAGTTLLATRGWVASSYQALSQGDKFQIGYRFYSVMSDVDPDANGKAVISVAPSLRETPSDGLALDIVNPACLMRLDSGTVKWSTSYDGVTSLSFGCVELR